MNTRADSCGKLIEKGFSSLSRNTFLNDATRAWNKIPVQSFFSFHSELLVSEGDLCSLVVYYQEKS